MFTSTSSDTIHSYNTRSALRVDGELWNEIPRKLRELPKKAFQSKLKQILFTILQKEDSYIELSKIITAH